MAKDLTVLQIERQNVLNNNLALPRIREALDVQAMEFKGKLYLTKQMVADFYEVSLSTVDRYLEQNADELKHNGYVLCKGNTLKEWKLQFGHLINDATNTGSGSRTLTHGVMGMLPSPTLWRNGKGS